MEKEPRLEPGKRKVQSSPDDHHGSSGEGNNVFHEAIERGNVPGGLCALKDDGPTGLGKREYADRGEKNEENKTETVTKELGGGSFQGFVLQGRNESKEQDVRSVRHLMGPWGVEKKYRRTSVNLLSITVRPGDRETKSG